MFNLNDRIQQNKKNWYNHILRMQQRRITEQMLQYKPTGHRDIGKHRRRWEDDLEMKNVVTAYLEVDDRK
jgi:hypothetical protein